MSQPTDSCQTRQQLDELEALMQRMLALPVSEGEEGLPALEKKPRPAMLPPRLRAIPDPPSWDDAPAGSATPAPDAPAPARPGPVVRPLNPRTSEPPPVVISERIRVEEFVAPPLPPAAPPVDAAAPPAVEPPAVEPPTVAPTVVPVVMKPLVETTLRRKVPPTQPAVEPPERLSWRTPLVWINQVFDRGTLYLGRSGRWLRGTQGRTWIGWTGLLLMSAAIVWALSDWLGWAW